ncbi:MAG: MFS transporter [Pikeienuella sp.]
MALLSIPTSMSDPEFRRYTLGSVVALTGMWGQRTVLAWLSWDLTGAAFWVGIVAFCSFAPTIFLSPIFGVFADRGNLKRAALLIQVFQAIVTSAALGFYVLGWLSIWPLTVFALAYGIVMSAHHPVRMALTPLLVRRENLPNAIAVSSMTFNLARLLGPAVAGIIIADYGVGPALTLTIVTTLILLWVLTSLKPQDAVGKATAPVGIIAAVTEGVSIAMGRRIIRQSLLLTAIFALIVRGMLELLPTLADGVFQRGADGLGQLMAAAGAGALCSAILIAGRAPPSAVTLPRRAIAAIFGGFLATTMIGVVDLWALALLGVAASGFCGTYVGVTLQSTVQMNIRDGERGRVMSLWSIVAIGAAAVGALLLGAAADVVGASSALWGGGVLGAAGIALVLAFDR